MKKFYIIFALAFVAMLAFAGVYGVDSPLFSMNTEISAEGTVIPFEIQKEDGSPAVENEDYIVENKVIVFPKSGNYKIIGDGVEKTDKVSFRVANAFVGEITLKDVRINLNGDKTAFKVESDAQLTLWIEGYNTLRSGDYGAAIEFMNATSGYLIIDAKDDSSYLWAQGWYGAAIGGASLRPREDDSVLRNVSNIEIRGGTIKATTMVVNGTAIGAIGNDSMFSDAEPTVSNLVISGGTITTDCSNKNECVGIGVGKGGKIASLSITGGTITTSGYGDSAAIGTGSMATIENLEITGGNIHATAYGNGAAIGAGVEGSIDTLSIRGGNIKAITEGDSTAIGIGPQLYPNYPVTLKSMRIDGGTIETSVKKAFYSIGAEDNEQIQELLINGGSIRTGLIPSCFRNDQGEELDLLVLSDMENVESVMIDGKDMQVSGNHEQDDALYFYLAKTSHEVKTKKQGEAASVTHYIWNGSQFEERESSPEENAWTKEPSIEGWTYLETANQPQGSARYGTITYQYSDQASGPFGALPSKVHAGTWYMKAEVAETSEYTGLSKIITFEVRKANAPTIQTPSNLRGAEGEALSSVQLPQGWTWNDPNEILTLQTSTYDAKYKVDDQNYDYSTVAGYDESGYVVRKLSVQVQQVQKENAWTKEPSIEGWTYLETANQPQGSARYGTITYQYSDQASGPFGALPSKVHAGTWYMKAEVAETSEYTGLSKIVTFEVRKAMPEYQTFALSAIYGQKLSELQIPDGFHWMQNQTVGNVGKQIHKAVFTPKDTQNYQSVENIEITIDVQKAKNAWLGELSIPSLVFGDALQIPAISAKHGSVQFLFSNQSDGNFTTTIPTMVGTWYGKAVVEGNANYDGIESEVVSFTISPKVVQAEDFVIAKDSDGNLLIQDQQGNALLEGIDYDAVYKSENEKEVVEIIFKGNYEGMIVQMLSDLEEVQEEDTLMQPNVSTGYQEMIGVYLCLLVGAGVLLWTLGKWYRCQK